MKYRYKIPIEKLEEHHIVFAQLYAESFDSLEAYNQSHKHINKVKASSLLQSPMIWEKVMEKIKSLEKKTTYQSELIFQYDYCKQNFGHYPTQLFQIYATNFHKNNLGYKKEDVDPLKVIRKLAFAYKFFNYLNREHFCCKIAIAIGKEKEYFDMLAAKNNNWRKDYSLLVKHLEEHNIKLNKIYNGSTKE